jgi:hypothetical protein
MIVLLIKAGAFPTNTGKDTFKAAQRAARELKWDCVLAFAENLVEDPNDIFNYGGAFSYAVRADRFDVAYALITAKGSKVWIGRESNNTNLHRAVLKQNISMIQLLVLHAPQLLESVNVEGYTPMTLAIQKEYWHLIPALTLNYHLNNNVLNDVIDNFTTPVSLPGLEFFKLKKENKAALFVQIMNIPDEVRRQKALWQALVPTTFLGTLFHVQFGAFPASHWSGTLSKVVTAAKALQEKNGLHIDAEIKTALENMNIGYGYHFRYFSKKPPLFVAVADNNNPPPPAPAAQIIAASSHYVPNDILIQPRPINNAQQHDDKPPTYDYDVQIELSVNQINAIAPQVPTTPVGLLSGQSIFAASGNNAALIASAPEEEKIGLSFAE